MSRYREHEAQLARFLREGPAADCSACARREAGVRRNREEFLAEISKLPQSVPTYAEYCHREGHAAEAVDATLDRAAGQRDDEAISTLVGLAREGRESDFRWLAASRGVPLAQLDVMWCQTLARLRKAATASRQLEALDGGRA